MPILWIRCLARAIQLSHRISDTASLTVKVDTGAVARPVTVGWKLEARHWPYTPLTRSSLRRSRLLICSPFTGPSCCSGVAWLGRPLPRLACRSFRGDLPKRCEASIDLGKGIGRLHEPLGRDSVHVSDPVQVVSLWLA
jgi:hypothetical protein